MDTGPYVGLVPYTRADAGYFFGRERERQIIAGNLLASRVTLLYGPSGVGKSSVLRAGVIPDLERMAATTARTDGAPEFAVVVMDAWRDDPIAHLAQRVDEALESLAPAPLTTIPAAAGLAERMRRRSDELDIDLLIVLDQFEEFFLYDTSSDAPGSFGAELAAITADPDLRVNVLISIREDALARLDRFKGRIAGLFGNMLRIEHLDRKAATAAIVRPIERYNGTERAGLPPIRIEPELVEAVLRDVRTGNVVLADGAGVGRHAGTRDDHVETPFLQLVMTRLWDAERSADPPSLVLRRSTLDALQGATAIVRAHLETVMAQLEPGEQAAAARAFQHLVTRSGTKIAYPVLDLAGEAGIEEQLLVRVLEKLSAGSVRVLRHVGPAPGNPIEPRFERYEIFHDVLAPAVLAWCRAWVQARDREVGERESARRAAEAAHAEARDRELAHAREIARISRQRVRIMALAAVGAVLLTVIALRQTVEARRQRDLASSRELAASANAAVDPELRIMLGIAGVEAAPTQEAVDALQRAVQDSRLVRTLHGSGARPFALALPDGRILAAAADSTLRVWSADSGDSLASAALPRTRLPFAWDARNRRVVMIEADDSGDSVAIVLVDPDDARETARSRFHALPPLVVSSLDGRLSIVRSDTALSVFVLVSDGAVVLFDTRSGTERVLPNTTGVVSADASPDGARIAIGNERGAVEVRDARTGARDPLFTRSGERAGFVAFSGDGGIILAIDDDGGVFSLEAGTGFVLDSLTATFPIAVARSRTGAGFALATLDSVLVTPYVGGYWWGLRAARATDLAFSPDGQLLATGDRDGGVAIWNVESAEPRFDLTGHSDDITSLEFLQDGSALVTAGDSTVRIWEMYSPLSYPTGTPVRDLAFDSTGATFAAALSYRGVEIVDARTGRAVRQVPDVFADRISLSPDGTRYATATGDEAGIHDAATSSEVGTLVRGRSEPQAADGRLLRVAWSPDGERVAFSRRDRTVTLAGANGEVLRRIAPDSAAVTALAWSPDARTLAVGHADGSVVLLDGISGERQSAIAHEAASSAARGVAAVSEIAFDPTGTRIAIAGHDRRVRIRTIASVRGSQFARLQDLEHAGAVLSVSWSPDGRTIATAALDEVVRIWNVDDASEAQRFVGRGVIDVVRFTPDGRRLFAAGEDGVVRAFLLDRDELLDFATGRVTRPMSAEECRRYRTQGWCGR